jgi:hypothetical protein
MRENKIYFRFASERLKEVLKGKTNKSFVDASFSENNLCGEDVIYDLGGKYILYFIKNPTWEGITSPAQLEASHKGTIDNIKRFIHIAKTEDKRIWRTLYLEIFQSGENQFFLEAYKELASLNEDKKIIFDSGYERPFCST